MNPFFFGRSARPLFGLYTQGRSGGGIAAAPRAVLLCYPLGSEYLRAHRAFRQLNTMLNRDGLHVLRFDYSCTGDSAGAGEEASVAEWLDDVDWAIDELLDTAGVTNIDVVGLRWGAMLAALAARERDEVRHLVLWDPVVSGRAYLESVLPEPRPDGTVGIEGYPFSKELRDGLEGLDLRTDLVEGTPLRTSLMVADDRPVYHELKATLEARGDRTSYDVIPSPGDWAQVDPFGDALIPQDIIRAIVDRLQDDR
jgi:pimeloyl-ACP methyl ester carboxylesterase